jgi:hypothetical protein
MAKVVGHAVTDAIINRTLSRLRPRPPIRVVL